MFGFNFSKRSTTDTSADAADYGISGGFSFLNKKKNSAMQLSTVFAAIEMISNAIAALPIEAKAKSVGKVFQGVRQGRYMFIKSMMTDLLLYGNGFAHIERKDGKVVGLRYIQATDVTIHWNKETNDLHYYCSFLGGVIEPEDMVHVYKNSKDGYVGISLLQFASRSIDLAQYCENAALDYYKEGLNISGILNAKVPMNKQQAQQALKSVEGNIETGAGKKIKFIPFDLELHTLTQNAKDAALVESRLYNVTEIARYFCISPVLLQDLSHSGYSTVEAANLQFLTQTLLPYVFIFETEFGRKLGTEINFDETALLRTDAKSTAEYYQGLVNNGIISVNEAREAIGFEPVEGGDKLTIAYTDVSQNTLNKDQAADKQSSEQN